MLYYYEILRYDATAVMNNNYCGKTKWLLVIIRLH